MAVTTIRIIDGKTYYQGLSTDTKPTSGQPGSMFFYSDSDGIYQWNGNSWNLLSSSSLLPNSA